jgi:hypothetical protein
MGCNVKAVVVSHSISIPHFPSLSNLQVVVMNRTPRLPICLQAVVMNRTPRLPLCLQAVVAMAALQVMRESSDPSFKMCMR